MVQYVRESYEEPKNHVTWPTLADSQREMVIVAIFPVLFSLVTWEMDSPFEWAIAEYFKFMQ